MPFHVPAIVTAIVLVALCLGGDSHYHTLAVSQSASQAHIKASYRALALARHPDKQPGVHYILAHYRLTIRSEARKEAAQHAFAKLSQ